MIARVLITYADGSTDDLVITAGDLARFQKRYGNKAASLPADQLSIEQQMFVAWSAAKRSGVTELELDAWMDTVAGCDEA